MLAARGSADPRNPVTIMNKAISKSIQDAVPGFGGGVM